MQFVLCIRGKLLQSNLEDKIQIAFFVIMAIIIGKAPISC